MAVQSRLRFQSGVNTLGLTHEIRIKRARDNTGVLWLLPMQADKVFAIKSENSTPVTNGISQYFLIRYRQFCLARFCYCHYIMP